MRGNRCKFAPLFEMRLDKERYIFETEAHKEASHDRRMPIVSAVFLSLGPDYFEDITVS